jgi:hypothetical protein
MNEQPVPKQSRMQAFGRHVMAGAVLLVCGIILFHFLFHLILWLAAVVAIIVAIIGAIWAIRVLF